MDEIVQDAVERAIHTINNNLGERLTVDDLARSAMFSKFHFSRVFQRVTGLSPGRFLSAVRLEGRELSLNERAGGREERKFSTADLVFGLGVERVSSNRREGNTISALAS